MRGCQRPQPIPRVSGMLGLNKPSARNKPFFLFRFENTFGYGAPGADAALHSPSGEGCRLGFLAPKTPSKVGQTAPSKGHTLTQTRRLGGENHSPGGKHVKAIAVLPFQTLAREQKHFFFFLWIPREAESEIACRSLLIFTWPPWKVASPTAHSPPRLPAPALGRI